MEKSFDDKLTLKQSKQFFNTIKAIIHFVDYFNIYNSISIIVYFFIFVEEIVKEIVSNPPSNYKIYHKNLDIDVTKKGKFFLYDFK